MKHYSRRVAALAVLLLLSGCALSDVWLGVARDQCDQSSGSGSARLDCYQRAESQARDIDR